MKHDSIIIVIKRVAGDFDSMTDDNDDDGQQKYHHRRHQTTQQLGMIQMKQHTIFNIVIVDILSSSFLSSPRFHGYRYASLWHVPSQLYFLQK